MFSNWKQISTARACGGIGNWQLLDRCSGTKPDTGCPRSAAWR